MDSGLWLATRFGVGSSKAQVAAGKTFRLGDPTRVLLQALGAFWGLFHALCFRFVSCSAMLETITE
jgi:hypothetical protein